MTTKKRLFWGITILLVVLSVWWTFTFPYDRVRLFAPIPFDAAYVGEHHNLAARWRSMARNPLIARALADGGVKPDELEDILQDRKIASLVKLLASENTVVAHVPSLMGEDRPAWVISSWVGTADRLLNWGLLNHALSDFETRRLANGRKVWTLRLGGGTPYPLFSFAVVEGLAVACFSSNAHDLDYLLHLHEYGKPKGLNTITRYRMDDGTDCADRGWADMRRLDADILNIPMLDYGFKSLTADTVKGWVRVPWHAPKPDPREVIYTDGITALHKLLGDEPDAMALLPFFNITRYLAMPTTSDGVRAVGNELARAADDNAICFIAMKGSDFAIKLQGLSVPSLLVGVKVDDPDRALSVVPPAINHCNAHYRTKFVPRHTTISGRPAIVLESTKRSQYMGFGPKQKPTFAIEKDWLLLASNSEILERMFAENRATAKDWTPPRAPKETCLGYAWLDLDSAGVDIENILAVYSLGLGFSPDEKSPQTRKKIKTTLRWLDAIRSLGSSCTVRLTGDGGESELYLDITPQ